MDSPTALMVIKRNGLSVREKKVRLPYSNLLKGVRRESEINRCLKGSYCMKYMFLRQKKVLRKNVGACEKLIVV